MFFVESTSNRGSEQPDHRICAKKGGSTATECKDMIANARKRKELKMLYVGITTLIAFLAARALHFADIDNSDMYTLLEELESSAELASIYIVLPSL
jgi:hypothetical protein